MKSLMDLLMLDPVQHGFFFLMFGWTVRVRGRIPFSEEKKNSIHANWNRFSTVKFVLPNSGIVYDRHFSCALRETSLPVVDWNKHKKKTKQKKMPEMFRNRSNKTTHAHNGLISGRERLFCRIFDAFVCFSDIIWHAHKNAHKILIICSCSHFFGSGLTSVPRTSSFTSNATALCCLVLTRFTVAEVPEILFQFFFSRLFLLLLLSKHEKHPRTIEIDEKKGISEREALS